MWAFETSKIASSNITPSSPDIFILPKQFYQLGPSVQIDDELIGTIFIQTIMDIFFLFSFFFFCYEVTQW